MAVNKLIFNYFAVASEVNFLDETYEFIDALSL